MALNRVFADHVEVVCGECGALSDLLLSDLKAHVRTVVFPRCAACNKTKLALNVAPGEIRHTGEAAVFQAWIKALHKKLTDTGHVDPEAVGIEVAADQYVGMNEWPTGDAVVQLVLPKVFATARARWLANQ